MKKSICIASIVLALSGCKKTPETHTVDYWKQHQVERDTLLKACRDDVTLGATPNCLNAQKAYEETKAFGDLNNIQTPDFTGPVPKRVPQR